MLHNPECIRMQTLWKLLPLLVRSALMLFSFTVLAETAVDDQVRALIADMKTSYSNLDHMQCRFTKDIVIDGRKVPKTIMVFKFRKTPKTICLEFLNRFKGRKCLYVEGENDNKMLVRPDGLMSFATFTVDPLGERAMAESTAPITKMGFGPIIETIEEWHRKSFSDPGVKIDYADDYPEAGRSFFRLFGEGETGNDFLLILIDRKTFSPYKMEYRHGNSYGLFLYEKIDINGGLTDSDFEI